jgi:F-type H+-transporting ATPase subunit delta
MMNNQIIARRYAKGLLLSLANESFVLVEEQLKVIADLLKDGSLEFARLCEDPSFSPQERREIIDIIAKKMGLVDTLHKFLLLLVEKSRLSLLPLIYEAMTKLVDQEKSRLQVTIVSATPVAESEINQITQSLMRAKHKKEVRMHSVIDQSLLGGIRVEVEGMVFDATLKAKLFALKSKLLHEIGIGQ